jgi:hypothetical protein
VDPPYGDGWEDDGTLGRRNVSHPRALHGRHPGASAATARTWFGTNDLPAERPRDWRPSNPARTGAVRRDALGDVPSVIEKPGPGEPANRINEWRTPRNPTPDLETNSAQKTSKQSANERTDDRQPGYQVHDEVNDPSEH